MSKLKHLLKVILSVLLTAFIANFIISVSNEISPTMTRVSVFAIIVIGAYWVVA